MSKKTAKKITFNTRPTTIEPKSLSFSTMADTPNKNESDGKPLSPENTGAIPKETQKTNTSSDESHETLSNLTEKHGREMDHLKNKYLTEIARAREETERLKNLSSATTTPIQKPQNLFGGTFPHLKPPYKPLHSDNEYLGASGSSIQSDVFKTPFKTPGMNQLGSDFDKLLTSQKTRYDEILGENNKIYAAK